MLKRRQFDPSQVSNVTLWMDAADPTTFSTQPYPPASAITPLTSTVIGTAPSTSISGVWGVAQGNDCNFYVTHPSDNKVYRVSPSGTITTFASSVSGAKGITKDSPGNFYVSGTGNVYKITTTGTVSTFATSTSLSTAGGITIDATSNLYLTNPSDSLIIKVTSTASVSTIVTGGYRQPTGIVWNSRDGYLYITNAGNNSPLTRCLTDGTDYSGFSGIGYSVNAQGICLGLDGNLYVSSVATNYISQISVTQLTDINPVWALTGSATYGIIQASDFNFYSTVSGKLVQIAGAFNSTQMQWNDKSASKNNFQTTFSNSTIGILGQLFPEKSVARLLWLDATDPTTIIRGSDGGVTQWTDKMGTANSATGTPNITTPPVSGYSLWYDGSDPSGNGILPADGSVVNTWVNKASPGTYNATSTGGATYSSTKKALSFNTTNVYSTGYPADPSTATMFVVFNSPITATNQFGFIGSDRSGGISFACGSSAGGSGSIGLVNAGKVWGATTSAGTYIANSTAIGTGYVNGSNNGVALGQTTTFYTNAAFTGTGALVNGTKIVIGDHNGSDINYRYKGYGMEFLYYPSILTTSQIQQVQLYLSQKWLGAGLPFPTTSVTPNIGAINGRDAMYFNGSSWFTGKLLKIDGLTPYNGTQLTAFCVARTPASQTTNTRILSLGVTTDVDYNSSNYTIAIYQPALFVGTYRNPNQVFGTITTNVPYISCTTFDGSKGSTYLNGSLTGSFASTGAFNISAYGLGNYVGAPVYGNEPFIGYIGEMIVFGSSFTNSQRQQMEGYLAWKWGTQTSLAANHPYLSTPAIVPSRTTTLDGLPSGIPGCVLWLDGKDQNATGTIQTTGLLTTWLDKSGQQNNAIVPTQVSGLPVPSSGGVTFDGTTKYFNILGLAGSLANTPFVVFAVETFTGSFSQKAWFFGDDANTTVTDSTLTLGYRQSGSPLGSGAYTMSFWNDDLNDMNYNTSSPTGVIRLWTNYLPAASNRNIRINGKLDATHTNYTQLNAFASPTLGRANGGFYYSGTISEVIVFNRDIGLPLIQQVETYLAAKWNIALSYTPSPLPSPKPAVYIPPNVQMTSIKNSGYGTPLYVPGCALWLDFLDPTTRILSGPSTTLAVLDKSGRGGAAIVTSGTITFPTINTIQGSLTIPIYYTEISRTVVLAGRVGAASTSTSPGNKYTFLDSLSSGSSPIQFGTSYNTANSQQSIGISYNGTSGISTNNPPNFFSSGFVLSCTQNANDLASSGIFINGVSLSLASTPTQSQMSFPTGLGYQVIGSPNGNAVQIFELLVFDGAISTLQRQQVEGYLAKKFSSVTSLYTLPNQAINYGYFSILPNSTQRTIIPNCQLWLDAADTGRFSYTTTGGVSAWNDKSGAGNHLNTAYNGNPLRITDNGQPVVSFASGNILQSTGTVAIGTTSTIFIVARLTAAQPQGMGYVVSFPGVNNGDFSVRATLSFVQSHDVNDFGYQNIYINGTSFSGVSSDIPSINSSYVIITGIAASSRTTTSTQIAISTSFGGTRYFVGNIAEVLLFSKITAFQSRQIEGYLAKKWNIPVSQQSSDGFSCVSSLVAISSSPPLGPFLDMPPPYLWLDGSDPTTYSYTGTGGSLASWYDKSGGCPAVGIPQNDQGAVTQKGEILNGQPTVYLGSSRLLFGGSRFQWNSSFTQIRVAKSLYGQIFVTLGLGDTTGSPYLSYVDAGNCQLLYLSNANGFYVSDILNPNCGPGNSPSNQWYILTIGYNHGTQAANYSINGVYRQTTTYGSPISTVSYVQSDFRINGWGQNFPGGTTQIAEFFHFNQCLTTAQNNQMIQYLSTKWGIPLGSPTPKPDSSSMTMFTVVQTPVSTSRMDFGFGNAPNSVPNSGIGVSVSSNIMCIPYVGPYTSNLSFNRIGTSPTSLLVTSYSAVSNAATGSYTFNANLDMQSSEFGNSFVNTPYYLGVGSNAAAFYTSELIVVNGALSTTDREQIEGYLSAKWGLGVQELPSYPYKTLPPVPTQWVDLSVPSKLPYLVSWLDASDPTTCTYSGANLTGIVDKAGGVFTILGTAGNITQSTIGNLAGLLFPGSQTVITNGFQTFVPLPGRGPIVYSSTDTNFYAAGFSDSKFYRISTAGVVTDLTSSVPVFNPTSMIVGNDGNIYINNGGDGSIFKYIPGTTTYTTFCPAATTTNAYGIAQGPDGKFYIANKAGSNIQVVPSTGGSTTTVLGSAYLSGLGGIVYANDGFLYVLCSNGKLYKTNPSTGSSNAVADLTVGPTLLQGIDGNLYTVVGGNGIVSISIPGYTVSTYQSSTIPSLWGMTQLPSGVFYVFGNSATYKVYVSSLSPSLAYLTKKWITPYTGSAIMVVNPLTTTGIATLTNIVGWGNDNNGLTPFGPVLALSNDGTLIVANGGVGNLCRPIVYSPTPGTPIILYFAWYGSNFYMSVNGSNVGLSPRASFNYVASNFYIGYDGGLAANMVVGEIVTFNNTLQTSTRQLLEGYLGWKWNMQSNLPLTHPYRSSAPTTDTTAELLAMNVPATIPTLSMWLDAGDTTTVIQSSPAIVPVQNTTLLSNIAMNTGNYTMVFDITFLTGAQPASFKNIFRVSSLSAGSDTLGTGSPRYPGVWVTPTGQGVTGNYVWVQPYSATQYPIFNIGPVTTGKTVRISLQQSNGVFNVNAYGGSVSYTSNNNSLTNMLGNYSLYCSDNEVSPANTVTCQFISYIADGVVYYGGVQDKSPVSNSLGYSILTTADLSTNAMPILKSTTPLLPGLYFNSSNNSMTSFLPSGLTSNITSFLVSTLCGNIHVVTGTETNGGTTSPGGQSFGFATSNVTSNYIAWVDGAASICNIKVAYAQGTGQVFASVYCNTITAEANFGSIVPTPTTLTTVMPSNTPWVFGYNTFTGVSSVYNSGFYIHEFLTFRGLLSDYDKQRIEGYLAWKWGITSKMPTTHPYISNRPYNVVFTPTSLPGLQLWLDGADKSSMSLVNGTNVQQWNDKSGQGNNASATTQSVYSSASGGLVFTGTQTYFTPLASQMPNQTVFSVIAYSGTSTMDIVSVSNITGIGGLQQTISGGTLGLKSYTGSSILTGTTATENLRFLYDYTFSTSGPSYGYSNGIQVSSTLSAYPLSGTGTVNIGGYNGGGTGKEPYFGVMSELLIYNTVLSTAQRQQVETYLSQKWGFVPSLIPGLRVWFDGADPSTITGTTTVTQWKDKSGLGNNATGNGVLSLVSGTGIIFNGTTGYFTIPGIANSVVGTSFCVFIVETLATTGAINGLLAHDSTGGTPVGSSFFTCYNPSPSVTFGWWNGDMATPGTFSVGAKRIWTFYYNGSQRAIRLNGSQVVSQSWTTNLATGSFASPVMGRMWGTYYYNGTIHELALYTGSTALTIPQIQLVEQYLINKWKVGL